MRYLGTPDGENFRRASIKTSALRSSVSALAVVGLLASHSALAQDSEENVDEDADVIVVTGIRESLANSQNIKRNADTVVDAITAEDIGALPDRSVTEALQRVPGVAISRFAGANNPDRFSVEGSGAVIRGLPFVNSEFNGRTAFAAGVWGQFLNFADVPPELLGSVIVSKNATADLIEGGIAGSINLVTRKPLDEKGLKLAFSAEANYGDMRQEWTPTISGLISNTWETGAGTFGLQLSASHSRLKTRSDGVQVQNIQTRDGQYIDIGFGGGAQTCRNRLPVGDVDSSTLPPGGAIDSCAAAETAGADGFADLADVRYAPIGAAFRRQEFDRERTGFAASAQFETLDGNTVFTAEYIRSDASNYINDRSYDAEGSLSEYNTYPIGCLQNTAGPPIINADGSTGGGTTRAQCPVGAFQNYTYDDNGLFSSGYITNPNDNWRGDPNASPFVPIGGVQHTQTGRGTFTETLNQDFSLNMNSWITDKLNVELDLQYAKSRNQQLDMFTVASNFADVELDLTGEYPQFALHLPQYLAYSWSAGDRASANATRTELDGLTDAEYLSDPRFQFWRSAQDHIEDSTGDQIAFSADFTYEVDEDAFLREIKFGGRVQDRDQTIRSSAYNWGGLSEVWAGQRPVNLDDTRDAVEYESFPDFFRGEVDVPGAFYVADNLVDNYDQLGAFFADVRDQWNDLGAGQGQGWIPLAERDGVIDGTPFLPSEIQPVQQQDTAGYVMARFGTDDLGGMRLAGNIGLRYVNTVVRTEGSLGIGSQADYQVTLPYDQTCNLTPPPPLPGQPPSPPINRSPACGFGPDGYAQVQQFAAQNGEGYNQAKSSYDFWLPSANLTLEVAPDVILRLAASKALSRPQNGYLRNFLNVNLGNGAFFGQTGNPFLKPVTAWNFDASAEWYFSRVGSLTFNAFYKEVSNFFYQSRVRRDVTNNGVTFPVTVTGPANFDGKGKIKGFEVAYQQTFDFLPGPLDGLGVQANYTYVDSNGLPNAFLAGGTLPSTSTVALGELPLERVSKHTVNAVGFYEKGPVSLRAAYNWRSRFLLTASDTIFPYYPIFQEDSGQLDASIFVNVLDNVKIGVQGVNLLNEVTETSQAYRGSEEFLGPRSYFMNDRRFSFIVRGSF